MRRESVAASFARIIRRERHRCALSQEQLAHKAKVHRTYIGLIERGLRTPTIEKAHAVAQALGLALSDMLSEAEKRASR